jgi:hypothetical protein
MNWMRVIRGVTNPSNAPALLGGLTRKMRGVLTLATSLINSTGSAQNLLGPPQPAVYTSSNPIEGLASFPTARTVGEEIVSLVSTSWPGISQTSTIRPPILMA